MVDQEQQCCGFEFADKERWQIVAHIQGLRNHAAEESVKSIADVSIVTPQRLIESNDEPQNRFTYLVGIPGGAIASEGDYSRKRFRSAISAGAAVQYYRVGGGVASSNLRHHVYYRTSERRTGS